MASVKKVLEKKSEKNDKAKVSKEDQIEQMADLLLERKHTDEAIADKVGVTVSKVSGLRKWMNDHPKEAGKDSKGKSLKDVPLEKIGVKSPIERAKKAVEEIIQKSRSKKEPDEPQEPEQTSSRRRRRE